MDRKRHLDTRECARICFDAFYKINTDHNFPPEMPERSMPEGLLGMMFSHPGFYAVVAESGGRIIGSNCLDERSTIFGVGPITIDPTVQNSGNGRQLMQAVLDRTAERGAPGVRLLQSAFHSRSLSLYIKLGSAVANVVGFNDQVAGDLPLQADTPLDINAFHPNPRHLADPKNRAGGQREPQP